MDTNTLWRSALIQLVVVAVLSIVLAIALPHSFFDSWGWLVGPLAWLACAAFTARVLALPLARTMVGAVLAGIPSAVAVLLHLHWEGAAVAVAVFAVWCARLPRQEHAAPA